MTDSKYDPQPIKAPRAAGVLLKAFTALVENKVTGPALAGKLLQEVGVLGLRKTPAEEVPSIRPPMPPGPSHEPANAIDGELLTELAHLPTAADSAFETIVDFQQAYREGKSTPERVAERVLDASRRLDRSDPPLRVFIAQNEADVMSQAKESTKRWAAGEPVGPLDGVPVAVKDELDQIGYSTTVGTRFLGQHPAERDAFAVGALRRAGALLIGKANMHEIGLGVTGLNPHHGPVRNPYDPSRATGGSSSGPAAAVAAGLCPLAVGADGGGSIRIPASLCGLVGLKPTYGRVSERGAAPLCWSVAHVGPISATARDAAIGYGLMSGTDPEDPHSLGQPPPQLNGFGDTDLSGTALGVYPPWFEDANDEVVYACKQMLEQLQGAGAEVVTVELPELGLVRVVHMVTIVSEMSASQQQHQAAHRRDYGHDTRLNLSLASQLTAADYVHAQRLRVRLCGHFQRALERIDAIVTPATAMPAPPISSDALATGESNLSTLEQIMRFAPAANLAGLPAISFPAGYTRSGLPIGFQAIGRLWQEHTLLKLAAVAETLTPRRKPTVHHRLLEG